MKIGREAGRMTGVGRIESVRGVAHPEYGSEGCLGDNSWSTGCTGGLAIWTRACKLFNVIAYLTHTNNNYVYKWLFDLPHPSSNKGCGSTI